MISIPHFLKREEKESGLAIPEKTKTLFPLRE
jgi:hypothetical protein